MSCNRRSHNKLYLDEDFGIKVSGFGCWVSGLGFRVSGFGFQGLDFWFSGFGFRVWGLSGFGANMRFFPKALFSSKWLKVSDCCC